MEPNLGRPSSSSRCRCCFRSFSWRSRSGIVDAFKLFDVIYVLTHGGPGTDTYTASYYLYQQGFQLFHLGHGTAGSWMLMLVILAVSYPLVKRIMKPTEA